MAQHQQVFDSMKKLGFSEYESKAYLKLLEKYPVNGYTLSKDSGIPRSRIYDVLKSLLAKQMVFEQLEGKNKLYQPVEPEVFLKKAKSDYEDIFSDIATATSEVHRKYEQSENLVVINGRRNIIDFINHLIEGAERRIAVSIWEEDIQELLPEIRRAVERGIILRGIYLGKRSPFKTLISHRRLKRYIAEKKQRYISIIIDGSTVLSGIVSRGEASKATWTRDEGFIEMSEDFIAHDLAVNLYSESLRGKEYARFEEFLENIYHHYYRYSEKETLHYKKLL